MIESQKGDLENFVTNNKQNITKKLGDSSTNEQEIHFKELEDNTIIPSKDTNDVKNLNLIEIIMERNILRDREKEWRLGFFTWFGIVSLHPQNVANGLHLYYILSV